MVFPVSDPKTTKYQGLIREDGTILNEANALSPSAISAFSTSLTTDAVTVGVDTACVAIIIQAANANTPNVLIGGASTQVFELAKGQSVTIPISNVNKVYAKMASSTGSINVIVLA